MRYRLRITNRYKFTNNNNHVGARPLACDFRSDKISRAGRPAQTLKRFICKFVLISNS